MIKDNLTYRGKIKVALKKGNVVVNKSTHNAGLPDMSMLFAKAISGTLDYNTDIPRLLDIGYTVNDTKSTTERAADNGVWESILNHPCTIGGRQFKYDAGLKNWVGELTTTVLATDLNGALFNNVLNNITGTDPKYTLKIRLCSYASKNRRYFAEVEPEDAESFLTQLRDSTSAIITWYCELLYNENGASDLSAGTITTQVGGDN